MSELGVSVRFFKQDGQELVEIKAGAQSVVHMATEERRKEHPAEYAAYQKAENPPVKKAESPPVKRVIEKPKTRPKELKKPKKKPKKLSKHT